MCLSFTHTFEQHILWYKCTAFYYIYTPMSQRAMRASVWTIDRSVGSCLLNHSNWLVYMSWTLHQKPILNHRNYSIQFLCMQSMVPSPYTDVNSCIWLLTTVNNVRQWYCIWSKITLASKVNKHGIWFVKSLLRYELVKLILVRPSQGNAISNIPCSSLYT